MLGYVLGLFFFYVLHDALQERAFRTPGFEFGWFMTAVEIGTMFVCALAWEGGLDPDVSRPIRSFWDETPFRGMRAKAERGAADRVELN